MQQEKELAVAKRKALALLAFAAAVFAGTLFVPHGFWTDWLRAAAEAAMIGGMADWFAVAALFRRIPLPGLAAHTNIIIRKRDDIADGLAGFVKEKFLDVPSVVALIDRHQPADALTRWLDSADNTRQIGDMLVRFAGGMLDVLDEKNIQAFLRKAVDATIDKVNLSDAAATLLDGLTRDGRHQELLDETIGQVVALLGQESVRTFVAAKIVEWLKRDHRLKEKVLPSEWIGNSAAEAISSFLGLVLEEVRSDPRHALRQRFDVATRALVEHLRTDPSYREKAEQIKQRLKTDSALNDYLGGLWQTWRIWLQVDLRREDSAVHKHIVTAGQWIGKELARNPALRASLNAHLREAATRMAPEFADFITRHIASTIRGWDAREMSRQIELHVGKDLQYIRMNGTIVGGLIGAGLYVIAHLPAFLGR
jgi:uncharacterized membrane-anchored protein YjiN (DUF445 family)